MILSKASLKKIIRESIASIDSSSMTATNRDEVNLVEKISHLIDQEMTARTGNQFWFDNYENIEVVRNMLDSVKDIYRGT